ncbi:hypothetical protein CIK06_19410 [Plantactinospora sp. KBS50]|nr:hypothetical protein CIK06_19410 [Plantactinospora sp. KBS50]
MSAGSGSVGGTGTSAGSGSVAGSGTGSAGGAAGETCPICGTPRGGRFCEEDGYDFVLAPPVPPADVRTAAAGAGGAGASGAAPGGAGGGAPGGAGGGAGGGGADPDGAVAAAGGAVGAAGGATAAAGGGAGLPGGLTVAVDADRRYFDVVVGMGGEDAGILSFPRFVVERRFPLADRQLLIGRTSRSRGITPDIDLAGPPEDPGVSHAHALLMPQPDGWAVVDLGSANGTYLNDPGSAALPAETPVPVAVGDRIYLGAWTCLSIRDA